MHLFFVVFRLELTNEALLGQSERLQERLKRLEEEGQISSRIIQVLFEPVDHDGHGGDHAGQSNTMTMFTWVDPKSCELQ